MKLKYIFPGLLLLLIIFSSCHKKAFRDQKALKELLDPELMADDTAHPKDRGRIVKRIHVGLCVDEYEKRMPEHGFTESGTPDPTANALTHRVITYMENFRGHELLVFLRKAARKNWRGKKGLTVRIVLGIYTDDYLKEYATSAEEIKHKLGRIGVFLVTCKRTEVEIDFSKAKDEDGDDEEAFDFGGLRP